ncbi:MAG TPA: Fic family protein [Xanthobacteraceae bacterium]
MYKAEPDPYCYPGTSILINLLDIRDQAALDAFEADVTAERSSQPLPPGRWSYRHYLAVHRHLFGDVYAWAGKIRKVRIAKQGHAFCYPEHIDREMRRLFADLEMRKRLRGLDSVAFAAYAAHFLAEMNAIHPFREGNGRTQLSFFTALAEQAGHPVRFDRFEPRTMLDAMIESFEGDEKPLAALIERLIS